MNRLTLLTVMSLAVLGAPALARAPKPAPVAAPAPGDFRTLDPENVLVIDTTKGRIFVEMIPEMAPLSVARIKELAREHFYDGLTFHRVVDDFMAQGGDPKGDGSGGSTKPNLPAEFIFRRGPGTPFVSVTALAGQEDGFIRSMPGRSQNTGLMVMTADGKVQAWGLWCPGVAGMARAGDPDSANSQFFLMRQFSEMLEHNYTPWGRVVYGENTVRELKKGEPVPDPDKMTSIRVLADLPAANRPQVQVLNPASAYLKTLAATSVSVCDIVLPAKVTP